MVKPYRLLLLLVYVGVILAAALYLLPQKIILPEGYSLRFFTLQSLFETQTPQYADVSEIEQKFSVPENKVAAGKNAMVPVEKTAPVDSFETRYKIQFPTGNDSVLHAFFRHLQGLETSGELVRALHYGDSQIEGDRITAALRHKFQYRFGGCGIGLVPLIDPLGNRTTLKIKSDEAWNRMLAFGKDYSRQMPRKYGLMGSYYQAAFSYTKIIPGDSLSTDSLKRQETRVVKKRPPVWVEYSKAPGATALDNRFDTFKLLYRNPEAPVKMTFSASKDSLQVFELPVSAEPTVLEIPFRGKFRKIRVQFEGSKSPDFFGAALDCSSGVVLDNLSFRGSSATEFTRMNKELLRAQFKQLNVKFIMLQFGVNVVPHVIPDYGYYEKQFYAQLKLLRELAPEASILVVGVSDVSRKEGEIYTTYPNVEKIRDAQRNAAFKAGCAFWDLYTAMGGKDSMPGWVFAKPALANKDFTHFTPKGAQLVAEMMFKSLMYEYDKFSKQ